jgi:splicing factor 3A subunit 3
VAELSARIRYLRGLLDYFDSFYRRALPLHDLEADMQEAEQEFEGKWAKGEVEGWGQSAENGSPAEGGIWCEACELNFYH